uniref:Uncharacterized protein n=1 Tax=Accipiter nisus TaxID=211598 RepID=A0A8B9N0T3_9AVES
TRLDPPHRTLKYNDINALNSSSETLLHVAAANGHLTIMEYLISKGAKIDVKDKKGRTPLHSAAEKGHGVAVKVLLRCGAYMYSLDMEGKTPLHLAAQNNHSHILKMLLKEEARSYRNQRNFLHMAALKDESSLAKMLLKAGASTDGKDERGQTALSYAVSQGSENTAKVLLEAGASVDSNMAERAFNSNHPSIFKILLDYSKDLSSDIMESALFRVVHVSRSNLLHTLGLLRVMQYYLGLCQLQCCSLSYLDIRKHLPANLCVWGCSALDLLDPLPMLINPVRRLGINQPEEQRVPKTLLTQ